MDTTHSHHRGTAGRVLVGLVTGVAATLHAFFWMFIGALQCDESCDGGSWHGTAGAWEWSALTALGIASWLLTVAFAVALGTRRDRGATWLFVAAVATAIAPWILIGF